MENTMETPQLACQAKDLCRALLVHACWCTSSCRVAAVQCQRGTGPCKATARHLTIWLRAQPFDLGAVTWDQLSEALRTAFRPADWMQ